MARMRRPARMARPDSVTLTISIRLVWSLSSVEQLIVYAFFSPGSRAERQDTRLLPSPKSAVLQAGALMCATVSISPGLVLKMVPAWRSISILTTEEALLGGTVLAPTVDVR